MLKFKKSTLSRIARERVSAEVKRQKQDKPSRKLYTVGQPEWELIIAGERDRKVSLVITYTIYDGTDTKYVAGKKVGETRERHEYTIELDDDEY